MASVIPLLDLTLSAPDRKTRSRRSAALPVTEPARVPRNPLHLSIDSTGLKVHAAGRWLEAKHVEKSRRKWRKLHLAVDAGNGKIVSHTLTDQDIDYPSQVAPLVDRTNGDITQVTVDVAYDGGPTLTTPLIFKPHRKYRRTPFVRRA
jgi:hypothetical protein